MKTINHLITLTCLALTLTACNDATTDEPLPDGTAPNEAPTQAEANAPTESEAPDASIDAGGEALGGRQSIPGMSYVLPEGWSVGPAQQMRLLTLVPPMDYQGAELAISHWPNGVGSLDQNIARWASPRFMDLTLDQVAAVREDFQAVEVSGRDAMWIPLTNPSTGQSMVGVWVPGPEGVNGPMDTWVFKLTGTTTQIEALAPAVRSWIETIRFTD